MKRIAEIGEDFLRCGGKRLRPRLCESVYRRLAPGGTADISRLCDAVECIHKASLIHDDIQDSSETRYGVPTVWAACGVPVAIAVGDWLMARGISLVAQSPFDNVAEMVALCVSSVLALSEGQGDELSGHGDYVSICERKTGGLFALAAGLGALAAGVCPDPYCEWGRTYGVLFQIMDDMADNGESPRLEELKRRFADRLSSLDVGPFL